MGYAFSMLISLIILLICPWAAWAEEAAPLPDTQLLVNQANPLPSYLAPEPLVSVNAFARGNANVWLREDAATALEAMLAALKEAGVNDVYVNSGYRNYVRQNQLHTAKVATYRRQGYDNEQAAAMAARWVLPAGESEHQTGLAVDISCSATRYQLIEAFASTPAGAWLGEHCVEYGFIIRYTQEKEALTGVASEPWHFRYVGKDHALYMRENNLCLEEYHALLKEQGQLEFTGSQGQPLVVCYSTGDNSDSLPGEVLSVSLARKNSGEYIITATPPLKPLYDTVNHWGEQQMRRLFEMQAIAGYEDGRFLPDNPVSRGEFVTIMARLPVWENGGRRSEDGDQKEESEANTEADTEAEANTKSEADIKSEVNTEANAKETEMAEPLSLPYLDVDATKYYYQPLEQCFRASLVQPMMERDAEPRLFKPEQALLRREAALMLATLLADDDFTLPMAPTYTDVPPAAEALFHAVELLTARGVFQGDGLGYFYPDVEVSRAEICAMLTRLLEALESE